jgi:tetratricopeptide (TPR) repeat protein
MSKENTLFVIIGLLLGTIIGFTFANSVNHSAATPTAATTTMAQTSAPPIEPNANMPAGHPDINSNQPSSSAPKPDIQAAADYAKKNPTDFEAQIKAAELYNQDEKYEESAEYLKIANKLKPDHYETIVNLGNVYFDGGKFEEAEKWYQNALAIKKDDGNVRTDLGLTFVFRDPANYNRAIQEFQTVLSANPNQVQALQNLVFAFTKSNDVNKAKETLAKLESADPANPAIAKLREEIQKLASK